ncbi:unnamed protein product [Adineta ricciae]|uniref:ADP-ribosylhydrolase ARH3 n=1 Tax=Adineta ricciae TaxID=249248 RepID=A0A814LUD2_ADIRI|nr:unnamed protein product [Adineta ricciae]
MESYVTISKHHTWAYMNLVLNNGLKPKHAARSYAEFWSTGIKRGYPESAEESMKCVLEGKIDYRECGRITFGEGSFANGGAMRIVPIALAFRHASNEQLYKAVQMAIISSHVHPNGIDGAFVLAKAIILALRCPSIDAFVPDQFLNVLHKTARTKAMKDQMKKLLNFYSMKHKVDSGGAKHEITDIDVVKALGDTFQIKAIEAVPCALWIICDSYQEPEECLVRGVNMGGDTDTVAAMIGDLVGALHGSHWIPARWSNHIEPNSEENLNRGKELAIDLAKKLAAMDLTDVLEDDD